MNNNSDDNMNNSCSPPSDAPIIDASVNGKRKRRPAGTPDPDAEVVSLSPKTLLESDRYICEICNQGFQRDQNLQMHRRRHKVPWKLVKRPENGVAGKKRVYVCPEPTCLHHDPMHALGDLVGIKKHFRRKHSSHKQWVCAKCGKGYAVQSDYKAHLKTCGTRGHSCDCGRVFSRVESFIEHQDTCHMARIRPDHSPSTMQQPAVCLSLKGSATTTAAGEKHGDGKANSSKKGQSCSLELQLLTSSSSPRESASGSKAGHTRSTTQLRLSIGSSSEYSGGKNDHCTAVVENPTTISSEEVELTEEVREAMEEKEYAEEARREARRQLERAERELAHAKRIRQHAQAELDKAESLHHHSLRHLSSALLPFTCPSCNLLFHPNVVPSSTTTTTSHVDQQAALSYMSTNPIFTAPDDKDFDPDHPLSSPDPFLIV